jgi:hypothetical protein
MLADLLLQRAGHARQSAQRENTQRHEYRCTQQQAEQGDDRGAVKEPPERMLDFDPPDDPPRFVHGARASQHRRVRRRSYFRYDSVAGVADVRSLLLVHGLTRQQLVQSIHLIRPQRGVGRDQPRRDRVRLYRGHELEVGAQAAKLDNGISEREHDGDDQRDRKRDSLY